MRKRIVSACIVLAVVMVGICVCYFGEGANKKTVLGNEDDEIVIFEMDPEHEYIMRPRLVLDKKNVEFVIENFPAASTNPNGPYVIEHDELVGTEAQTKLTYRFEIKDRETLIFHKDNEYGLLEDGSVFKLK